MQTQSIKYLFGGPIPWDASLWTPQTDALRGGTSTAHLSLSVPPHSSRSSFPSSDANTVLFHGTLTPLPPPAIAGFASVITTPTPALDLSRAVGGLVLDIARADGKKYVLVLKDALSEDAEDGAGGGGRVGEEDRGPDSGKGKKERSTLSYEAVFTPDAKGGKVRIRWEDFRAVYRGRETGGDGMDLKRARVVRLAVMMRSFFGEQEGDFKLVIGSIAALEADEDIEERGDVASSESRKEDDDSGDEKAHPQPLLSHQSWFRRLWGSCMKL